MELFPDFDFEAKPESEPELAAVQLPAAPAISDEIKKRLVKLANEVCKLEPWLEIHESELFGIADPDSKLVNWCSVIGGGGDVFTIQFHEPPEAIKFWNKAFCDEEPNMGPGLPDTRLLECSLTPLEDVEEEDLAMASVLRKLPKKVKSIPCFRSFRPGFIPWFIDENDAQRLCLFLEVFTKFFTRVYDDYSRYHDMHNGRIDFPVFRLKKNGVAENMDDWQVKQERFPEPAPAISELPPADTNLKLYDKLKTKNEVWEIASFYLPDPVAEGPRPYFAKMPICINTKKNKFPVQHKANLYGGEDCISDTEALRGALAGTVEVAGYLPKKIRIASETARLAFLELAELKGIELVDGPFEEINQFISGIAGADSEEIKEVETLISALPKELQQELVDEGPGSTIFEKLGMLAAEMVEKEEALGNLLNVDFAGEAAASSAEDFPEVKNAEEHFRIRVVMPGIKELERVFSMPSDATFFHLHLALQEFFDWDNEHLFDFSKGKGQKRVEVGLRCGDLPLTTRIDHFANNDGSFDKFSYTYDFSDEWEHQITIGKRRLKPKQPTLETRLISGKGVAPLEDCGGIPGHYAILDGTHPFCEELETEFFESYSKEKFDMKNYSSLSNQGLQKSYGYHLECGMF